MKESAQSHATASTARKAPAWLVIAAFIAVYVIWGSTYLGIRLAIDSMPPLLMAGSRFLLAGLILYGTMRFRGVARPQFEHWRNATFIGAALLLVGNGGVSLAQQTVPSGLAALMVAATPIWMNLMDWVRPGGKRPRSVVFAGLLIGFCGVALIALGKNSQGQKVIDPMGAAMLLAAPFCWAAGSIFSRHTRQPSHPLLAIGMQMIMGGVLLLLAGVISNELPRVNPAQFSATSIWAFVYLTLIGSLVGFTAYVWLLQVSTPAKVSTYAYVNPFIAVLLGHLILNERFPPLVLGAGAMILAAVVLLTIPARR